MPIEFQLEEDIKKYHIDKESLLYVYDIAYANYKRDMRKQGASSYWTFDGFIKSTIHSANGDIETRTMYIEKLIPLHLRKDKVKKILC